MTGVSTHRTHLPGEAAAQTWAPRTTPSVGALLKWQNKDTPEKSEEAWVVWSAVWVQGRVEFPGDYRRRQ